jgi:hypothetical protein
MFNSIVQSLKEIGNPKVQDGQIIENIEERGTEKPVVQDEDGEITEEGFVSIGRSSFYSLNNEAFANLGQAKSLYPTIAPSPSSNMPKPMDQGHGHGSPYTYSSNPSNLPYPLHPHQTYQHHQSQSQYHHPPLQSQPSIEINDMVRGLPLVLHPDLRPYIPMYDSRQVNRLCNSGPRNFDPSEFDYDFNFERGVLRDISRQFN